MGPRILSVYPTRALDMKMNTGSGWNQQSHVHHNNCHRCFHTPSLHFISIDFIDFVGTWLFYTWDINEWPIWQPSGFMLPHYKICIIVSAGARSKAYPVVHLWHHNIFLCDALSPYLSLFFRICLIEDFTFSTHYRTWVQHLSFYNEDEKKQLYWLNFCLVVKRTGMLSYSSEE